MIVNNPENYYKIVIFIPFVGHIINDLRTRFDQILKKIFL